MLNLGPVGFRSCRLALALPQTSALAIFRLSGFNSELVLTLASRAESEKEPPT